LPALVVALLLVGHGLIHASFLAPAPAQQPGAPAWPFHFDASWLLTPLGLDPSVIRLVGVVLIAVTVGGYVAAAVAFLGIAPAGWFMPAIVVGSSASLAVLILFFSPWLVLGFAIDAVLLWAVLVSGWAPKATV
jgi:hypothetical protein